MDKNWVGLALTIIVGLTLGSVGYSVPLRLIAAAAVVCAETTIVILLVRFAMSSSKTCTTKE